MKKKLWDWNKDTFGQLKEHKQRIWDKVKMIDKFVEEDGFMVENVGVKKHRSSFGRVGHAVKSGRNSLETKS